MTRQILTAALALAVGLSNAAQLQDTPSASPQLTGDLVYENGNVSSDPDAYSHQNHHFSSEADCGFLIEGSSELFLSDSNITRVDYGLAGPGRTSRSAAVCVVNESTFDFKQGSISTSGNGLVGLRATGGNTTVRLSDVLIENKGSFAFGLAAQRDAVLLADLIQYSSDSTGTCAFVADGGDITIHESVAHAQGRWSSIFCAFLRDDKLDQIHAQEVTAVSEQGPAVVLSGNVWLADFTNCTLMAGGVAVILSTIAGSALPNTVLRVTQSQITATNPTSPVLLFELEDIDAIFYRTELIPSASNLLALVACGADTQYRDCIPFDAAVVVSESFIVGDIQA